MVERPSQIDGSSSYAPRIMSSCGLEHVERWVQAVDIRHWTVGRAMTLGASTMAAVATADIQPLALARNLRRSVITVSHEGCLFKVTLRVGMRRPISHPCSVAH